MHIRSKAPEVYTTLLAEMRGSPATKKENSHGPSTKKHKKLGQFALGHKKHAPERSDAHPTMQSPEKKVYADFAQALTRASEQGVTFAPSAKDAVKELDAAAVLAAVKDPTDRTELLRAVVRTTFEPLREREPTPGERWYDGTMEYFMANDMFRGEQEAFRGISDLPFKDEAEQAGVSLFRRALKGADPAWFTQAYSARDEAEQQRLVAFTAEISQGLYGIPNVMEVISEKINSLPVAETAQFAHNIEKLDIDTVVVPHGLPPIAA